MGGGVEAQVTTAWCEDRFLCWFTFHTDMAKTDHFYIRANVDGSLAQTEIDLGAFVDALGKSVLKIHSVSLMILDSGTPGGSIGVNANQVDFVSWQLTTQSQAGFVGFEDKSVITAGCEVFVNDTGVGGNFSTMIQIGDRVDQKWVDGYLVAVEQIFFRADAAGAQLSTGPINVSLIMDCTIETLTKESAMALALSQQ